MLVITKLVETGTGGREQDGITGMRLLPRGRDCLGEARDLLDLDVPGKIAKHQGRGLAEHNRGPAAPGERGYQGGVRLALVATTRQPYERPVHGADRHRGRC